jgi:hypothetical protein
LGGNKSVCHTCAVHSQSAASNISLTHDGSGQPLCKLQL